MPNRTSTTGSELFIVDNTDMDWKVLRYLHDWCQISRAIDIATGYMEIGALLALKDEWQKVDQIRILMGNEVSLRTRDAFGKCLSDIEARLDGSIEAEKQQNDFLTGVPAIAQAIRSGKIRCRVYRKDKFHAKAYITHARLEVVGAAALVGSSNFTLPGLTENIELNVQITGRTVAVLQEWYEEHWNAAEDVTAEILQTIERHVREYTPFEVYAKSLQEFFRGHEQTASEWETGAGEKCSRIYPLLDQYQKDGYHQLQKIADRWAGAFLCDGLGLGKTFIGLMLIEWLVEYRRKRVALFVPKAAREPVWEPALRKYLPHLAGDFTSLVTYNHSDLTRGGDFRRRFEQLKKRADAIVIDEAHHFRNPGIAGMGERRPSRYRHMYEIAERKQLYLLTATPVNNRLIDLQHMIELFSRRQPDYFKHAPLGIHSLFGHFRKMEKELERLVLDRSHGGNNEGGIPPTDLAEAERVLTDDSLFRAIVVQRSRSYVKESQQKNGGSVAIFPTREPPRVAEYELKKTYGNLLGMVDLAFRKTKPLFALGIYCPLVYHKRPDEAKDWKWQKGRQVQVVQLIRTGFLKRFESSAEAFDQSCRALLRRILAWVEVHAETDAEKRHLSKWKTMHAKLVGEVERQRDLFDAQEEDENDVELVPDELLDDVEKLSRDDYRVEEMLSDCYIDLEQLYLFLKEMENLDPTKDDKLNTLIRLLKTDPVLRNHKVLIFSEFMTTARHLEQQLKAAGIEGVAEIDSASASSAARNDVIRRFSPYYNDSSSAELAAKKGQEIRVLISTDVLSEGLNLQDATRLINYDLHWNPVRLMQRIGRVDRRMNPEVEARIAADHPDQKDLRGNVAYWNFLPPDELNRLLSLYSRVTHKTLRISRTFGIEGKKLLTPDDDYQALKDFNAQYDGQQNDEEKMKLQWQDLLREHPDLAEKLDRMPLKVFSGKVHPTPDTKAVFFCYARPGPPSPISSAGLFDADDSAPSSPAPAGNGAGWSEATGDVKWYLYDLATGKVLEEPAEIDRVIRCTPDTPRQHIMPEQTLAEIRAKIEKHIKNTYFKAAQAPIGVRPVLKAWMELS